MSLQIAIPKSDLAKSIPVANGWTEFEITGAVARPSKDGASVNYVISHKVVNDPNERVIDHLFNSKALGMMNTWIAALTNKTVQEVLDGITSGALNLDLESTYGKKIMGKVDQQIYEGRVISKIVDWAPVGKVPF